MSNENEYNYNYLDSDDYNLLGDEHSHKEMEAIKCDIVNVTDSLYGYRQDMLDKEKFDVLKAVRLELVSLMDELNVIISELGECNEQ